MVFLGGAAEGTGDDEEAKRSSKKSFKDRTRVEEEQDEVDDMEPYYVIPKQQQQQLQARQQKVEEEKEGGKIEQTYALPNKRQHHHPARNGKSGGKSAVIEVVKRVSAETFFEEEEEDESKERKLGLAIVEGKVGEVKELLEKHRTDQGFMLGEIDLRRIADALEIDGNDADLLPERMSPIELADHFDRRKVIDVLLDHGLETIPHFPDYLHALSDANPGLAMDHLVERAPEIVSRCLDQSLVEEAESGDHAHAPHPKSLSSSSSITLDLTPFRKRRKRRRRKWKVVSAESRPLRLMLRCGHRDLIKHPVTETFIHLKWRSLRKFFWAGLVYDIFLAVAVGAAATSSTDGRAFGVASSCVALFLMVPFAAKLILDLVIAVSNPRRSTKSSSPSFVRGVLSAIVRYRPCFSGVVRLLLICTGTTSLCLLLMQKRGSAGGGGLHPRRHLSCWSVLLAWINVLLTVRRCPRAGIHVHALGVVLKDVLRFLLATMSIFVGFFLALHGLLEQEDFGSAFLSVLSMVFGHFQHDQDLDLSPGTAEIVLTLFALVVVVGVFNVLVGISVANVKDVWSQQEDFRLGQMIVNVDDVEVFLLCLANMVGKCSCWNKSCLVLLKSEAECRFVINKPPGRREGGEGNVIPLRFGNPPEVELPVYKVRVHGGGDHKPTPTSLSVVPAWVWRNARDIQQEQWLRRSSAAASDEAKGDYKGEEGEEEEDLYTDLVWRESTSDNSDEGYEPVGEGKPGGGPGGPSNFVGGLFRRAPSSMRESVLKELRREMQKLVGGKQREPFLPSSSSSFAASGDGKCVNVRPGVALGLITLQAGSAGPRIALHQY